MTGSNVWLAERRSRHVHWTMVNISRTAGVYWRVAWLIRSTILVSGADCTSVEASGYLED